MEYVEEEVMYRYMVRTYHPRIELGRLIIDKGIPVKWFREIVFRYKTHYKIEDVIVE